MSTFNDPPLACAVAAPRWESLQSWLGDKLVYIPPPHRYVSLDEVARAKWRRASWGPAWKLTCLHSGLNPECLYWSTVRFWSQVACDALRPNSAQEHRAHAGQIAGK